MSNGILESKVQLSPDLAEFTELGSNSLFGDVCLWLNEYVESHGLANGKLPLLGGKYPGPLVKFDECLAYLFKPYLAGMGINIGEPVEYSQFKSLCLYHIKFVDE